jgi:hypothetical protein
LQDDLYKAVPTHYLVFLPAVVLAMGGSMFCWNIGGSLAHHWWNWSVKGIAARDVLAVITVLLVIIGWGREHQRRRWQRVELALEDVLDAWKRLEAATGISPYWEAVLSVVKESGDKKKWRKCVGVAMKLRAIKPPRDIDDDRIRDEWCKARWNHVKRKVGAVELGPALEVEVQMKLSPELHAAYGDWNRALAGSRSLVRAWPDLDRLHVVAEEYVRYWWAYAINGSPHLGDRTTAYAKAKDAVAALHDSILDRKHA